MAVVAVTLYKEGLELVQYLPQKNQALIARNLGKGAQRCMQRWAPLGLVLSFGKSRHQPRRHDRYPGPGEHHSDPKANDAPGLARP
jgi:hypothetical protein